MPKGKRGFGSGADWKGNTHGRGPSYRAKFTEEIFKNRKGDITEGVDEWFRQVKLGKSWAIKLLVETYLTKPNMDMDVMIHDNSEQAKNILSRVPPALLEQIRGYMVNDNGEDLGEREHDNGS